VAGRETFGEIVNETELDKSLVSKYLSVLQELRIVEREPPVFFIIFSSIKARTRLKKGKYVITDNYFKFWFRFVYPNKTFLESGDLNAFIRSSAENLTHTLREVFESLGTKHLLRALINEPLTEVGRWWRKGEEIDVVAMNGKVFIAEVKWSAISESKAKIIWKI